MTVDSHIKLKMLILKYILMDEELSQKIICELDLEDQLLEDWIIHLIDLLLYSLDNNDLQAISLLRSHFNLLCKHKCLNMNTSIKTVTLGYESMLSFDYSIPGFLADILQDDS
jgi:hypothetical protein